MKKVILFGATGNLGKEIAKELINNNYAVAAVVRHKHKGGTQSPSLHYVYADVTNPQELAGICNGYDIVISALGKSVSVTDKSKPSFHDIDFVANSHILNEAINSGVQKFVYVSALHSERYQHLTYFKVHHDLSEKLKASGLNYSIIKPPAIFSAFTDLMDMARKGTLMHIGPGDKLTNPIYEGDLAKVCVSSINENNATIEAGGKLTYTRRQINDLIQTAVKPGKKVPTVSPALLKLTLPVMKLFNRNQYDKFAFFLEVMEHDTIAPPVGATTLEQYLAMKLDRTDKKGLHT